MQRQWMLRLSALVPIVAVIFVLAFSAVPSQTAYACLPCNCPEYTTVNCWGPYNLYTPSEDDVCSIDIWVVDNGQGKRALEVTDEELAELPDAEDIDGYVVVGDALNGYITLYKLQNDRYQINVGPDGEGKVHTIDFVGCPADDVHEDTFVVGQ